MLVTVLYQFWDIGDKPYQECTFNNVTNIIDITAVV